MMLPNADDLLAILRDNPDIIAVWHARDRRAPTLKIILRQNAKHPNPLLPKHLQHLRLHFQYSSPFRTLHLPLAEADQICYNEPIPAGVQIQPQGQPWVGTLGALCAWPHDSNKLAWGILSCAHVLCPAEPYSRHPIHQPLDNYPQCAQLSQWRYPSPDRPNLFDAAIANCKIAGHHTVGPTIKCLGQPDDLPRDPAVADQVSKCGRTTGLTHARCTATDVACRVTYPNFEATFTGQALFTSAPAPFSAPGDSGSLIVHTHTLQPAALLFAGNDDLTIGSPITTIVNYFNLTFLPKE